MHQEYITSPAGKAVTKVAAYGWSFSDKPGIMQPVAKELLHIDPDYQRLKINNVKVLSIARIWSWVKCGTLIVARRPDGTLFVVDGQHRKLAADKRSDITELPCIIFYALSVEDEARDFLAVNTGRTGVGTVDKFRAMLRYGDQAAVTVDAFIKANGYTISENARSEDQNSVKCIMQILRCHKENPQVAERIFEMCAQIADGKKIDEKLYGGMFYLEKAIAPNHSLADYDYVPVLAKIGVPAILKSIGEARAFYVGDGGTRVWAIGIHRLVNKGRRTRKLPEIA